MDLLPLMAGHKCDTGCGVQVFKGLLVALIIAQLG
jgi:hypothetical protein